MDGNIKLHAGHRERMLNKFAENPDAFSDHELLEILLFYFIPRKNTNDIAHKLLRAFGTLDKVFSATEKELMSVDGIGKRTAAGLLLIGKFVYAIKDRERQKPYFKNFAIVKQRLMQLFYGLKEEKLLLILLDINFKEITKIEFCDNCFNKVSAEISEIAKAFALHKPKHAIIVHNHTSNSSEPSKEDDITTQKINILCEVHGVKLVDHIIFSKCDDYSYNDTGRLERIKKVADLNKILDIEGEDIWER